MIEMFITMDDYFIGVTMLPASLHYCLTVLLGYINLFQMEFLVCPILVLQNAVNSGCFLQHNYHSPKQATSVYVYYNISSTDTVQRKILTGENFGEFGETNTIWQYIFLPSQIPASLKQLMLAIVNSPTFSLPKLKKRSIRQSFTPPKLALYGSFNQLAIYVFEVRNK